MDPLSDVLPLLNMTSASPCRLEATGRWHLECRSYQFVKVCAVLTGSFWVAAGDAPPVHMRAGGCYLLTSGLPYRMASDLSAPAVDGWDLFVRAGSRIVRYGTAAGNHAPDDYSPTIVIGGNVTFDDYAGTLLLHGLPPVLRIAGSTDPARVLHPVLRILLDETTDDRPGTEAGSQHLTKILFLSTLRSLVADPTHDHASLGWLGALHATEQIGAALSLMHREPAHRWTVETLARAAAMPRSAFAQRFKDLVGLHPLDYLMRWRIHAAQHALRSTDRSVSSIAAE